MTPAQRRKCPAPRPCAHRETTIQLMAELYVGAQAMMERGYRQPLTLASVARTLAASPRQLERAYDEIGLTTFSAQLRAVRLRNAAELLAQQPLTVTDVARLVGYRQPSHFVKAFRRRFGITPGAFRDAARRDAAVPGREMPAGRPRRPEVAAGPSPRPEATTTEAPRSQQPTSPPPTHGVERLRRADALLEPELRRRAAPSS